MRIWNREHLPTKKKVHLLLQAMLFKWDTFHFEGEKSLFPAESHSKRFISSQRLVAEFLQRTYTNHKWLWQPANNQEITATCQYFPDSPAFHDWGFSNQYHTFVQQPLAIIWEIQIFSYTSGCQVDTNQSVGLCNSDLSNIWIFFPELKQIYITISSSFLDLNIFFYLCVYFYTWTLNSVLRIPETLAIVRNSVKLRATVYVWEQH